MSDGRDEAAVMFAQLSAGIGLSRVSADADGHVAIEGCVSALREKTLRAGGRVVKRMRYQLMSAFPGAENAAEAALEMQSAVSQLPMVCGTRLALAVGFHYGPLLEREDGDVFGNAVNIAARLAAVAAEGQVITARDTVMRMPPMLRAATRPITRVQVKGIAEPIEVYEFLWRQGDDVTTAGARERPKAREATLRLLVQGRELLLSSRRPTVSIGRDASADLVVRALKASRAHARIERRMDKFVLVDQSANGTFVTVEGLQEIVLRREEFMLRGHGWIALGQPRTGADVVVEFFAD